MAHLFENPFSNQLINLVVLCDQNSKCMPTLCSAIFARTSHSSRRLPLRLADHADDQVKQLRLFHRFAQAPCHANLSETVLILRQSGCEYYDLHVFILWISHDLLGNRESVHARHMPIQQHQCEKPVTCERILQITQSGRPAVSCHRTHLPVREHFLQNLPVRQIIIHDQDREIGERMLRFRRSVALCSLYRKSRSEMKRTATTRFALDRNHSTHERY